MLYEPTVSVWLSWFLVSFVLSVVFILTSSLVFLALRVRHGQIDIFLTRSESTLEPNRVRPLLTHEDRFCFLLIYDRGWKRTCQSRIRPRYEFLVVCSSYTPRWERWCWSWRFVFAGVGGTPVTKMTDGANPVDRKTEENRETEGGDWPGGETRHEGIRIAGLEGPEERPHVPNDWPSQVSRRQPELLLPKLPLVQEAIHPLQSPIQSTDEPTQDWKNKSHIS